MKACNGLERRRILHLAYERWHEREILRGLASHRSYRGLSDFKDRPAAQVFFCIDEREESMRRALEEADPEVETFSSAGYFGVAVDYKGIDDPQGAAFCPVVVKPRHAVVEQSKPEDSALAGEAPLAQAASRSAHAAVVLIVADADARLALYQRSRIALGRSSDRSSAGAQALCATA